jgi:3-hydroxybutyryl-CoA dehydratase
MAQSGYAARGKYFEEFAVGQRILTPGRTIAEADVLAFAGLSGDFNSIHTDAEYARNSTFGQRVAHGLLGVAIASGLATRTGVLEGTVLAFREINDWKFSRPILVGDTIHAALEVLQAKPLPRLGGGAITLSVDVLNQKDESLMKGRWTILVLSRTSSGSTPSD